MPVPVVNVEVGIAETIQAIDAILKRRHEEAQTRQDKSLVELRQQLEIAAAVVSKLEDMFIEIVEGYKNPRITEHPVALQAHLDQTRTLLVSRRLVPKLDTALGVIEAAASSSRFEGADYRDMLEEIRELDRKLYSWRMALGPGGCTGPGIWRLQELCQLAEDQLATESQPVDPEIASVATEAFERYDWRLSAEIRRSIASVKLNS